MTPADFSVAFVVITFALLLAAVGWKVLIGLITNDVKGWLPHWSASIVRNAARRLPADDRPRWEEETLADVNQFADRPLSGFVLAVRMALSVRSLAAELTEEPVADAEPVERRGVERARRLLTITAAASASASTYLSRRSQRVPAFPLGFGMVQVAATVTGVVAGKWVIAAVGAGLLLAAIAGGYLSRK